MRYPAMLAVRPRATFALLLAALTATPSAAANLPDNLQSSLKYRVVGTISSSCSLTQGAQTVAVIGLQDPYDDTVQSTETQLPFELYCTAPVQVTMASTNGALLASQATTSDQDFVSRVDFRATLDLPGTLGALACRSAAMAPGGTGCSAKISNAALGGAGRIRLSTDASGKLLLAGTYSDTVTLTISPQLDGGG